MTTTTEMAYWAGVASDFKMFLRQAFLTVNPGKEFMDAWYIDAIAHALVRSRRGELPRLIINLPPRYLKSFIVSVAWPAFLMGCDSTVRIICVSYSEDLAKTFSRDFRRILESPWYRRLFPQVVVTKSTEAETVTSQGGTRYAVSVGGSLTGRGADFIIVDDPLKPEDALSERLRTSNNDWSRSTLFTRLDDKQRSVMIIVMQRLHVNDLTGYLGSSEFYKLSLPAIATHAEQIPVSDGEFYTRRQGDVLNPEREPLDVLEQIRDTIGAANFAAQYQQAPDAPEGALIKAKYLRYLDRMPRPRLEGIHWISIDAAASTSEHSDYTAITMGYSDRDGHFVLAGGRGRWDFETLLEKSLRLLKRFPDATFVIENASAGTSLILALRKRGIRVIQHDAKLDKVVRLAIVLPVIAAHRVTIIDMPGQNDWIRQFVNELLSFPNGRFDDQVDSLVQGIRWAERFVGQYWTPDVDDGIE